MNLQDIAINLQYGRAREASALVNQAIAEHYDIETIIKDGVVPAIRALDRQYRRGEIIIPELRRAGRALRHGLRQIKQAIARSGEAERGAVVLGSAGDLEAPGQGVLAVALEGKGLRVVDLGARAAPERYIQTALAEGAKLIICTAALVTALPRMKALLQAVNAAGVRDRFAVMLAGAPVTGRFCRTVGADFYAPDPAAAASLAGGVFH
jgi:5-methyltetrahydrofolate--homocysteine methyltransferase